VGQRTIVYLCGVVVMTFVAASPAQESRPAARASGTPLLRPDPIDALKPAGGEQRLGRVETINTPKGAAVRIQTESAPANEWGVQVAAATIANVKRGDVVLAEFWLRCAQSMTEEGFTTFVFEQKGGEHAKGAEMRAGARQQWRQVHVPFRATRDFAAGQAQVCFRAGFDRQTIEIAGVRVVNLGPDAKLEDLPRTRPTYGGREPDAAWRKEALTRIEDIRKGDLVIHVTDASGRPIANAQVRATLKRHAFGFGSAVTVEHVLGESDDARRYRDIVERYFNTAVFENDMKWPAGWDGIKPDVDKALDWLLEREIRVRGHNLHWPSWRWSPKQLRQYESNPDELRRRTYERVTGAVGHFKGKLVHWDVINEPYSEHDLMDVLGKDVMVEWFKLAKAADPACQMYLNDYGIFDGTGRNEHREHFYSTIKWLKDSGAPIDGVGIQSHFGSVLPPMTQVFSVLERFSEFGMPIESTEVSLNSDDRQLQADFMRDYLIACFSHPRVSGVMLWGFWEGRHWRPQAALWEKDWTARPIATAWLDLVHKQWKTKAELTTDADGAAQLRGFHGDYDVVVSLGPKSKAASARLAGREGGRVTVVLE